MRNNYVFIAILTCIIVMILSEGFALVGLPSDARDAGYDQTRAQNFQEIGSKIQDWYGKFHRLPTQLFDIYSTGVPRDPQTSKEYEYHYLTSTSYKLCTVFSINSVKDLSRYSTDTNIRTHKKGYDCWTYTVVSDNPGFVKPFYPSPSIYISPVNYVPPVTPNLTPLIFKKPSTKTWRNFINEKNGFRVILDGESVKNEVGEMKETDHLGTLRAGETYVVTYIVRNQWHVSGYNRSINGELTAIYPAIQSSPLDYKLNLWGKVFTFNEKGEVSDPQLGVVGHLQ